MEVSKISTNSLVEPQGAGRVSCPIEFRANLRRRAKPGVDLLSATRIRLLNRAGPTKAPCIMATSSPDGVRNPRRILNYLGQNTHRHRPFVRCLYFLLKRPNPIMFTPQSVLFRVYIQVALPYR